jgi:hypothetical protein
VPFAATLPSGVTTSHSRWVSPGASNRKPAVSSHARAVPTGLVSFGL